MAEVFCSRTSLPELLQLKNKFYVDIQELKMKHLAILENAKKQTFDNNNNSDGHIMNEAIVNGDISLNALYNKDDEVFTFCHPNSPRSPTTTTRLSSHNSYDIIQTTNSTHNNANSNNGLKETLLKSTNHTVDDILSLHMSKLIQFNTELFMLKNNYFKSCNILANDSILPDLNHYQQFDSEIELNNILQGLFQEYLSYYEIHILSKLKMQQSRMERDIDGMMKRILNNNSSCSSSSCSRNNSSKKNQQSTAGSSNRSGGDDDDDDDDGFIRRLKESDVVEILKAFIHKCNQSLGFQKYIVMSNNNSSSNRNDDDDDIINTVQSSSSSSFSRINIATWTLPFYTSSVSQSKIDISSSLKLLPVSFDVILQQIVLYYNEAKVKLILQLHQQYITDLHTIEISFQQSCVNEIPIVMIEVEASSKRRNGLIMSKYESILLLHNHCNSHKSIVLNKMNRLTDKPHDIQLIQESMNQYIHTTVIPQFLSVYTPVFHTWLQNRRKKIEKEIDQSVDEIINNPQTDVVYNEEEITMKLSQILVDMKKSIDEKVYVYHATTGDKNENPGSNMNNTNTNNDDDDDGNKDYRAHFDGLFHYYLDRTSQARKANFIKLESEIDRLILVLTTDMRQARDGLLKQMEKGGNRGESMMISLTEAAEYITPKLHDMKTIYAESIIKLLGDKNHPGVVASLNSVDSTISQILEKLQESYVPIFLSWIHDRKPFIEKYIHTAMEDVMNNEEGYSEIECNQQFEFIWNHIQSMLGVDLYITSEELELSDQSSNNNSNDSSNSYSSSSSSSSSSNNSRNDHNSSSNSNNNSNKPSNGYMNYKKEFRIVLEGLRDVYHSYIDLITVSNKRKYDGHQILMISMLMPFVQQVEQRILNFALEGGGERGGGGGDIVMGEKDVMNTKSSTSNNNSSKNKDNNNNSSSKTTHTTNIHTTSSPKATVSSSSSSSSSLYGDTTANTAPAIIRHSYTREELSLEFESIVNLMYKELKETSKQTAFHNTILKAFEKECNGIQLKLNDYYQSMRLVRVNYILSQVKLDICRDISQYYNQVEKNKQSILMISNAIQSIGDEYIQKSIHSLDIYELTFHEIEEWIKIPMYEYIDKCKNNCIQYIERIRFELQTTSPKQRSATSIDWLLPSVLLNNMRKNHQTKKKSIYL